jgi:4-aminobutyrate aminotransferase
MDTLAGSRNREILERDTRCIGAALRLRLYPLVIERAEGVNVWDADGKQYIDFEAGATVACTGYCHPTVMEAIKQQLGKLSHNSFTLYSNETTIELAEKLLNLLGREGEAKVWFGLAGGDANECICKLVPLFTKKQKIITFMGAYHGMTMGALSLSGHKALAKFSSLPNVVKAPYPYCYRCPFMAEYPPCCGRCVDFIESTIMKTISPPEDTCCILVEPIQSDSGNSIPPEDFLPRLKGICQSHGLYMAVDEIKTGFGRTGKMFAFQHSNLSPEIVTMGKSIASGMPLSACVASSEILDSAPATHLTSVGGSPVSCAAALATIEVIEKEKLAENSEVMGSYMKKRLAEMQDDHRLIGDIRGLGLLLGIELVKDRRTKEPAPIETAKLCYQCWEKGLIVTYVGTYSNVIEMTPPLVLNKEMAEEGLIRFEQALKDVEAGRVSDEKIEAFRGW